MISVEDNLALKPHRAIRCLSSLHSEVFWQCLSPLVLVKGCRVKVFVRRKCRQGQFEEMHNYLRVSPTKENRMIVTQPCKIQTHIKKPTDEWHAADVCCLLIEWSEITEILPQCLHKECSICHSQWHWGTQKQKTKQYFVHCYVWGHCMKFYIELAHL